MGNNLKSMFLTSVFSLSTGLTLSLPAVAEDPAPEDDSVQSTVFVTGVRGEPRSIADSPVAVDVFDQETLESVSFVDTNDVLKTLVPSYSLGRQPISDGASFIRPASLRGLPTDKTLVLVNSKRRHRASLVSIGGSGTQGPDIATIPASAIKSVTVLRDGAAAQYGSDAIAGVIDFILKDNANGASLTVQTGQYYEGDGTEFLVAGNAGFGLGDSGFLSVSAEFSSAEATVRAQEYCQSWACVDPNDPAFGVPGDGIVGFSEETFLAGLPDANIGDGDVVQPWGAPPIDAVRTFYNAGYTFDNGIEAYSFGNWSRSSSDGSFFYRFPGNSVIQNLRNEDGSLYSPLLKFPGGFTPRFFGTVIDYSALAGLRGELENGLTWDLSGRFGHDEIQYTLKNTVNPSLGENSPTSFNPGDLINEEIQFQADFTKPFEIGTYSPLTVAFGASYMEEEYEIVQGGEASYIAGPHAVQDPFGFCNPDMTPSAAGMAVIANGSTLDCADSSDPVYKTVGVGSNGFPGYGPDVAGTLTRDSQAVYFEVSNDITENLFLQAAGRLEDYSDFGEEFVWKVAGKYTFSDAFGIRGSASTGFRAPTPGQLGTTNVSTRLPNGTPVASGLFPATSAPAAALGASPLEPETSDNFTLGFVGEVGGLTYTVDFYKIDIQDRTYAVSPISIINDIDFPALNTGMDAPAGSEYASALDAAGVANANTIGAVQFFQNAFDTTTEGVDVVLTYPMEWSNGQSTAFTAAFNYGQTEFDGGVGVDLEGNPFLNAEDAYDFENFTPDWRSTITAVHDFGGWSLLGRASLFGPYENADSGGATGNKQEFDTEVFFDVEATFDMTESAALTFGARNIFDNYPDEADPAIGDSCCGRIYLSGSQVDWQGGYYYMRLTADF